MENIAVWEIVVLEQVENPYNFLMSFEKGLIQWKEIRLGLTQFEQLDLSISK